LAFGTRHSQEAINCQQTNSHTAFAKAMSDSMPVNPEPGDPPVSHRPPVHRHRSLCLTAAWLNIAARFTARETRQHQAQLFELGRRG